MEHRIKEAKGTILIYKGEPICYNILNTFAEQLGEALQRLGEEVEYFDVKQSGEAALAAYAGKTYQAVIGFQSYLFDIYLPKAGVYLHDLIKGPKINFQFDHPIWMKNHYIRMPEHCYIATHDRNYAAFIEKYYPRIAGSSIIFPGGCEKAAGENGKQEAERNLRGAQDKKEYQISFIGTYTDYRSYLPLIRNSQGIIKKIAAHFLFRMKQHPEETAEKALEESLRKDGIVLSDEEFLEVLDGVKPMIYCIMSYYREKAVKVILEAGITLEVFGDSWKKSPFGDSPYLRIHEAVDMRESLEVMEKSLISFNVMAWHKDGFTERIANSMLQHSVVLKRINRVSVGEQETEYIERINRIFSRQQYEYSGSIHEQVTAKNKEEYETYLAPVVILHDGYEGTEEERRKKAERNLKLLLKELENHPDDTYFMYQIGKSYYMAEDYEEAIRYFEKALGYDLNPKLEYVIDMVESYGYALLNTGRVETALQFQGIYEEFGDCADFKFLMGLIYMNNERYEEAVAEFLKATEYKSARMTGTNSYLAYYNAGVIRECLGDIGQALEYYRKCGDYAKAQERIRACSKGE